VKAATKLEQKQDRAERGAALDNFLRANLFLFFRARAAGEAMAQSFGLSTGKWSLMRSVREEGPQTVADIARARPVARQGVQRMADQLADDGMIEFIDNPAHRRAKLVRIAAKGEETLRQLDANFAPLIERLAAHFSADELKIATDAVKKLSAAMAALLNDSTLRATLLEPRLDRKRRTASLSAQDSRAIDDRVRAVLVEALR